MELDLTEAVEAAAAHQYDIDYAAPWGDEPDENIREAYRGTVAPTILTAAPLIAAQVRAQAWQTVEVMAANLDAPKRADEEQTAYAIRMVRAAAVYDAARLLRGDS